MSFIYPSPQTILFSHIFSGAQIFMITLDKVSPSRRKIIFRGCGSRKWVNSFLGASSRERSAPAAHTCALIVLDDSPIIVRVMHGVDAQRSSCRCWRQLPNHQGERVAGCFCIHCARHTEWVWMAAAFFPLVVATATAHSHPGPINFNSSPTICGLRSRINERSINHNQPLATNLWSHAKAPFMKSLCRLLAWCCETRWAPLWKSSEPLCALFTSAHVLLFVPRRDGERAPITPGQWIVCVVCLSFVTTIACKIFFTIEELPLGKYFGIHFFYFSNVACF